MLEATVESGFLSCILMSDDIDSAKYGLSGTCNFSSLGDVGSTSLSFGGTTALVSLFLSSFFLKLLKLTFELYPLSAFARGLGASSLGAFAPAAARAASSALSPSYPESKLLGIRIWTS